MLFQRVAAAALLCLTLAAPGQSKENWVWSPEEQEVVYPKARFDAAATMAQLEPGSCTLQGTAYVQGKKGDRLKSNKAKRPVAYGTTIYLFPYTDYCEEVVGMLRKFAVVQPEKSARTLQAEAELRALTGKGVPELLPRKRVDYDPTWPTMLRQTTTIDDQGTFVFENIKPGRYYVQSQNLKVERLVEYAEKTGELVTTTTYGDGHEDVQVEDITRSDYANMYRDATLETMVVVKEGGPTVMELHEE